jgi:hypothetical protein
MKESITKSLLTSLFQREGIGLLWQRGARGDFSIIMPYFLFSMRYE